MIHLTVVRLKSGLACVRVFGESPDFKDKPRLAKTQKSGFFGVRILSEPLYLVHGNFTNAIGILKILITKYFTIWIYWDWYLYCWWSRANWTILIHFWSVRKYLWKYYIANRTKTDNIYIIISILYHINYIMHDNRVSIQSAQSQWDLHREMRSKSFAMHPQLPVQRCKLSESMY